MWRKSGWIFDDSGGIQGHQSAARRFIACEVPVDLGVIGRLYFLYTL